MLSFIIPAYNEEAFLGRTLSAIRRAGEELDEPWEIVVADDGSTDRTADVARELGARVVPVHNRQIAATRNDGARAALGNMLLFVDADTVVTPQAVKAAIAAMRTGAIGGGCAFRFDGKVPLLGRILQFIALPLYQWLGLASGCFVFAQRQAFENVGGFDTSLYAGEEAAFSRAMHRQGRFVILREEVVTSARKLRTYSAWEILGTLGRFALRGSMSLKRRKGLDIWYGERRPDAEG
jgi:glycosyltransferase involved in cell wall biosynthesis